MDDGVAKQAYNSLSLRVRVRAYPTGRVGTGGLEQFGDEAA